MSDQGDVRTRTSLIECKHAGTYDKPAKSISIKLSDLEKIANEAWSESKQPMIGLSIYAPDSILSNHGGFVDLTVRLSDDDAMLTEEFYGDG